MASQPGYVEVDAKGAVTRRFSRHPILRGKSPSVWWPEAVGVVKCYPKTAEEHERRRKACSERLQARMANGFRLRCPPGTKKGTALRPKSAHVLQFLAEEEAKRIMAYLRKEDLLVNSENEMAMEALQVAVAIHRNENNDQKLRLAAAQTVLNWTKAKPASASTVTVRRAEDFLEEIALATKGT